MSAYAALLTICLLAQVDSPRQTVDSIEETRGGLHLVNKKMDPPKSPTESLKTFQIEPGYELQLVAAEPVVIDPVAIAFDKRGKMFVVEYGDYPTGPDKGGKPLSRVVQLEDTDGDGRMDKRTVFADGLDFAHSLMAWDGGMLVGAKTQIIHLVDSNGDGKADVRKILFSGFVPAHPQMQIGNPRWGLDNWIYFNYGPGTIVSSRDTKPVKISRSEFKYHPATGKFGPAGGLGQFGNTIDNWGRRFFCTNRNPIMYNAIPLGVDGRNPDVAIGRTYLDLGPTGGDAKVYPTVAMRSNYLSHAGSHTSACGVTAYRGALLGSAFENSVFVCEPIGHLITRSTLVDDGPLWKAKRARENADFLTSTDRWFRPASLETGPDGALYIADMYRMHVEHPKFLPAEIAKLIDWRAGEKHGRVYRVVPKGKKARDYTAPKTDDDLITLLQDANGWRRWLAQRLIVEGRKNSLAPKLKKLVKNGKSAYTRLQAMWTLHGLGTLEKEVVFAALQDDSPFVRKDAVRLCTEKLAPAKDRLSTLSKMVSDSSAMVRMELAMALGEFDSPAAGHALSEIARSDSASPWTTKVVLNSAGNHYAYLLPRLISDGKYVGKGTSAKEDFVERLGAAIGVRGKKDDLDMLFRLIASGPEEAQWWQASLLIGVANGLPRSRGELGKTTLAKLMNSPPQMLKTYLIRVALMFDRVAAVVMDDDRQLHHRTAGFQLLRLQGTAELRPVVDALLKPSQPAALQLAALNAAPRLGVKGMNEFILGRWTAFGPALRQVAIPMMLSRTDTTLSLLQAMDADKVNAAAVSIDQRLRLLKHSNQQIKGLSVRLFGGAVSKNRMAVAAKYRKALSTTASHQRGQLVFEKNCSKCHRINGKGHVVGPDISDVRNRSKEALLYDILDPNRKVEPRFGEYSIQTDDGRVLNGLMVSENADAIVLRLPEGKEMSVARSEIDAIKVSGKSLMPEGIEKEVTLQQMADLLAFLKGEK